MELPLVETGAEDVDEAPDVDPEAEGERRLDRLEALVLHHPRRAGPLPEPLNINLHIELAQINCQDVRVFRVLVFLLMYKVTMVVMHLGWVDLDLLCSTLLLGSW